MKFKGKVDRIIDGDTLDIWVDLGFRVHSHQRFRLEYVNTPERGQSLYTEASALLDDLVKQEQDEDGFIYFTSIKTGKYGRWLFWNDRINMTLMLKWPYENKHKSIMNKLIKEFKSSIAEEFTNIEKKEKLYTESLIDSFIYANQDYNFISSYNNRGIKL